MKWTYNDEVYDELHTPEVFGFIYKITFEDGDGELYSYYGKKQVKARIKKHFGKRKLAEATDKRKKTYEYVIKEAKWKDYIGSCKDTEGYIPIAKEILCFANSGRELTYLEAKALFARGALEDEKCLNANVLGRFFRGNIK